MSLIRMLVRTFSPSFIRTFLLTAAIGYAAALALAASLAAVSPARDILIEPIMTDGLLEEEGNYIIITHPDFIGPLGGYINHRAADGFTVRAVTTDQIYNVFPPSPGEEHLSIKSYLAYAYFFWTLKPRFVAIFGDASKTEPEINKVPYYYYEAREYGYLWPNQGYVDDWFVDFTGNDLIPEIPIGRIPVRTVGDVYNYISKVVTYESDLHPSWQNKTFVCINDEDLPGGGSTPPPTQEYLNQLYGAAQEINAVLATSKNTEEIRASDYTGDGAWLEFKDRFESGSALGVFFGFGAYKKLGYFVNDPPRTGYVVDINNQDKYNVFLANGCILRGDSISIAYELTAFGNRGSVACLLPSDAYNCPAYSYVPFEYFCRYFSMAGNMRLGDAWRFAKTASLDSGEAPPSFIHCFQLAGDPALKIIGGGSYFPYLLGGWPQPTGHYAAEPVASADVTPPIGGIPGEDTDGLSIPDPVGSGPQDIVASARNRAFAWGSEGEEIFDFTLSSNNAYGCLADIDTDGKLDYVTIRGGGIQVYNNEGEPLDNFPVTIPDYVQYPPAVGDMNGDGCLDILCVGDSGEKLYAVDRTGQALPGWPKVAPSGWYFWGTPSIGDVDADGELEAVVAYGQGNSGKLIVVSDSNGIEETLTFANDVDPARAVLANIDADADLEIVIGCERLVPDYGGVDEQLENLFVLDRVGGQYSVLWYTDVDGDVEFPPCVGDFRWANPGKEVLLVREGMAGSPGHLSVYDALDGERLADRVLDSDPTSAPTVADIVDQHGLEVLFGMPDELAAYNVCFDMPKVQNWNGALNGWVTTPLVTDLDGNGSCDIVCSDGEAVYAFTTNAPYAGLENFDWVRDGHDNLNMGLWDIAAPTGVVAEDYAEDQGGKIVVAWTPSVDDGVRSTRAAKYKIYRKIGDIVEPDGADGDLSTDRAVRKKVAEGKRVAALSGSGVSVQPPSSGTNASNPGPLTDNPGTYDEEGFAYLATVTSPTFYYVDEGLENLREHEYYVVATDLGETYTSQRSVIVSAVPHDNIPPAPPTNFDLDIIHGQPPMVLLSWTRSIDDPLYQVVEPDSSREITRVSGFGRPGGVASPVPTSTAAAAGADSVSANAAASDAGGAPGTYDFAARAPAAFPWSEKQGEAAKMKAAEGRRLSAHYGTTGPRPASGVRPVGGGFDAGANDVSTYIITKDAFCIYYYPDTPGNDVEYLDEDVSYGYSYAYWVKAYDGENDSENVGPLIADLLTMPPGDGGPFAFAPEGPAAFEPYYDPSGGGSLAAPFAVTGWGAGRTGAAKVISCKPNPVTGTATFTVTLPAACPVKLDVYDLAGRRVDTVLSKTVKAGGETVLWQPRVPTGVYIYRLQTPGRQYSGKVVVAR